MEIGKLLKEKHGFTDIKTLISFKCKYNYSSSFIQSLLDDNYSELLPIHLKEISEFTGVPIEELSKLQTPRSQEEEWKSIAPLGRFWGSYPVISKLEIKDIEECLKNK